MLKFMHWLIKFLILNLSKYLVILKCNKYLNRFDSPNFILMKKQASFTISGNMRLTEESMKNQETANPHTEFMKHFIIVYYFNIILLISFGKEFFSSQRINNFHLIEAKMLKIHI